MRKSFHSISHFVSCLTQSTASGGVPHILLEETDRIGTAFSAIERPDGYALRKRPMTTTGICSLYFRIANFDDQTCVSENNRLYL